jgi:hypothetical protein
MIRPTDVVGEDVFYEGLNGPVLGRVDDCPCEVPSGYASRAASLRRGVPSRTRRLPS